MGFFSSIVNFVKNVVKSVLGAIARFMNSVFGSPVIAALAMLVLAICMMGVSTFMMYMNNPVLLLSNTAGFLLLSLMANVLIQVVSLVCPELGKALGYAFGLFSIFMLGLNLYTLVENGTWTGATLLANLTSGLIDVPTAKLADLFIWLNVAGTLAMVTGLAEGVDASGNPKSAYTAAYIDGFFAPAESVAGVADDALGALTSTVTGWLMIAAGCFVTYKVITAPRRAPQAEPPPARLALEGMS